MKRLLLIQTLAIFIIVGFSGTLFALPATVELEFTGVSPSASGRVYFPDTPAEDTFGSINAVYGQYNFRIDWDSDKDFDGTIGGYCVENVYAPPKGNTYPYSVIDVYENYRVAAYVLENSSLTAQASQLLVWETVFDYDYADPSDLSLIDGSFKAGHINDFTEEAQNFLDNLGATFWEGLDSFTGSGYKILRNPIDPQIGAGTEYQDYLVSVPDASLMYLLGPALIGLGFLGRRKNG